MQRVAIYLLILVSPLAVATAFAGDTTSRVNTQPSANVLPAPNANEVKRGATAIKIPKNLTVPAEWIPLLNRAYEEYWMEGNHRPDAGFVLFARNPSKETAKLWLLRMESKAQNLEELFAYVKDAQKDLVNAGLMADRYNMVNQAAPQAVRESPAGSTANVGSDSAKAAFGDLQFYFLYSPTCPHCARLAQNLVGFPNVHPLQVTGGELVNWSGLPASDHATPETIEAYVRDGEQPGGVPVLAIYEPKSNRVLKLRGARSTQEILAAAAVVKGQAQPPTESKWPYNGPVHPSKIGEQTGQRRYLPEFPKL